ncbi:MAG: hypothetical protein MI867_12430 [Pseudomonadales bacterium]|nr:hypothetical protein [Pseudomonadales bacterium]
MAENDVTLVEIVYYDPDTAGEDTLRYADGEGFNPVDNSIPTYEPRLIDPGNIENLLFSRGHTIGLNTSGRGRIIINNADGGLDGLRNYGFARGVTIRRGSNSSNNPTDLTTIFTGTSLGRIERTEFEIGIDVENRLAEIYSLPFGVIKYDGDTTDATYGSGGHVNGTDTTIQGKNRPYLFGNGGGENYTLPLVNHSKQTFQLSQNEVRSITTVWNGGAAQTQGTSHTTLTSLQGATVTSGEYDYYLGDNSKDADDPERGCYIRIGGTVSGDVTAKAVEGWANLCLQSEDLSAGAWTRSNSVTTNQATGPDGQTTMDQTATVSATSHYIYQTITVEAQKSYTFSWYAAVASGDGTTPTYAIYDASNTSFITVNQPYTVSSTVQRYSVTFTTPSGCTSVRVYPVRGVSGDSLQLYLGYLQLEKASTVGPYVKTTASVDYNDSMVNCIARALQHKGITPDWDSFVLMNYKQSASGGIWVGIDEVESGNVVSAMNEGINAYFNVSTGGAFRIGRIEDPASGTSVLTLEKEKLLGDEKVRRFASNDQNGDMPASQIIYHYNKNYTIQGQADIPGNTDAERVEQLKHEYNAISKDAAASVTTKHPKAVPFEIFSLLTDSSEADTEATRQKTLRTTEREFAEITVHEKFVRTVEEGNVITVEDTRYSDTGSDKWLVLGKIYEYVEREVTLILWK